MWTQRLYQDNWSGFRNHRQIQGFHSLVHITSEHPFTKSSVRYASETALDIIVATKGPEAKRKHKMVELLESSAGNPLTASLCRYIFEPYCIELLEKGGDFTCRSALTVLPVTLAGCERKVSSRRRNYVGS